MRRSRKSGALTRTRRNLLRSLLRYIRLSIAAMISICAWHLREMRTLESWTNESATHFSFYLFIRITIIPPQKKIADDAKQERQIDTVDRSLVRNVILTTFCSCRFYSFLLFIRYHYTTKKAIGGFLSFRWSSEYDTRPGKFIRIESIDYINE